MATLLDEILQETNSTAGKCSAGCKCVACNFQRTQPRMGHKTWRERRSERANAARKGLSTVKPVVKSDAPVSNEFEFEATSPTTGRLVILVAGHNYSSPGHKMVTYCLNRCQILLKKDSTLRFVIFDVTGGKAMTGRLVSGKLEWKDIKIYKPVTSAHYTTSGGHKVFTGDPGVISITEVYKLIRGIGASEPSTIAELSFFGHGWMGGPILANSYDSFVGANWKPERDPMDNDPRTFKDFNVPNMSSADIANFKRAFAPDGFTWIWGCSFPRAYFQVLHRVLKSSVYRTKYPKAIADTDTISFSFSTLHADDFFHIDTVFFPPRNSAGKYPLTFSRTFKEVKEYIARGLYISYASAIARASGVPCRSAFLGTYSDYEKVSTLPLQIVPRKVPPYSDNFSAYINFYKIYMGMSEDPEMRGYGIYLP